MGYKRFSFICIFLICLKGLCVYSGQKVGIYDYDVLVANPDLIQQEPGRTTDGSRQSVEKDNVRGLYDMDTGSRIYAESRSEGDSERRPATSRSKRGATKPSIQGQGSDESTQVTQSFSDVSEQVRSSTSQEKVKKTPATARAFQTQASRLFDFEDNPEYPDLTTVVTDNVKPAISPE